MAVNQSVLEILIRAKDEASKSLQSINGWVDKNQASFQGLAAVGGTVFTGLVASAYKGITAYAEVERANRQLENAIISVSKGTAEQVQTINALTKSFEDKVGVDAEALKVGVAQLATFGLQSKSVVDLTKSLADYTVNQKGLNASSSDYIETANTIAKALNGQFGALERSGTRFTEAQQKMILFGKESEKVAALTEGLKQNLRETTDTVNGIDVALAKANRTFESIGDGIGAAMRPAFIALMEAVTPLIGAISSWVEQNPRLVSSIVLVGGAVAATLTAVGAFGMAIPAITAGFQALNPWIVLAAGALASMAGAFVGSGASVELVREKFVGLMNLLEEKMGLISSFQSIWSTLSQLFNETVVPTALRVWEMFERHRELFALLAKGVGVFLVAALETLVKTLEILLAVGVPVAGLAVDIATAFTDVLLSAIELVIDSVTALVEALQDAWNWGKKVATLGFGGDDSSSDKGKALGGTVMGRQSYIVGENGPEQFTPGTSGFIGPVQGGGGQGVQVIINGGIFAQDAHEMAEYLGDLIVERFQFGGAKI